MVPPSDKTFLFLQGPHGPFFHQLGKMISKAGSTVLRVGFNAGDAAFWARDPSYIPFRGPLAEWPARFLDLVAEYGVTDIVLYGDTRPVHAKAVACAKAAGLTIHVFEEGYMRPYWVTYERDGSNGHSMLMDLTVAQMQGRLEQSDDDPPIPPSHWGDMRQHIFYGALYHWFVMFRNRRYPNFRPHRALPVRKEAALYTKRLFMMPFVTLGRRWTTRRIKAGGYPYHIALLQLEHDASFQAHSNFPDMTAFVQTVIEGFASGAPQHHHLVFKAHPLDNGQSSLRPIIKELARRSRIGGRVHFVAGGKLAGLLGDARSAVTVNSTAGQQALWRGIPLKSFGTSVYDKPEFTSRQPLPEFFAAPTRPEQGAYHSYRSFLLKTSQVPGGYYSRRGRKQLLRHLVDKMLSEQGPYETVQRPSEPPLRIVS